MSSYNSWIYEDYDNNIWLFSISGNRELCYKIIYSEGKQTREGIIDKNIIGFAVTIENDGKIHIVYSNANGRIKYCTLKESKWYGRTLYLMESGNFDVCDIKIQIIADEMQIFYLLIDKNDGNYGVLVHSIWNGKETRSTKLSDIVLIPDAKETYAIYADDDKNIDLLFITQEGTDEASVNYCSYREQGWTRIKKLYGIQGRGVEFKLLNDKKDIHILNKHSEGQRHYLDHVRFDLNGDLRMFKIHESGSEFTEPLLFRANDKVCAGWLEENKIHYSAFDGIGWADPGCFNRGNAHPVSRYHFYIAGDQETGAHEKEIYGTGDTDLTLYFPGEFVSADTNSLEEDTKQSDQIRLEDAQATENHNEESLRKMKLQLNREKSERERLKAAVASLTSQLQKKQGRLDACKVKIAKLQELKKNTEENCDMVIEVQQNLQNRLELAGRRLKEEEDSKTVLERSLKESEAEKAVLKQQLDRLAEENTQLKKEFEAQKSKTIMERLLKL